MSEHKVREGTQGSFLFMSECRASPQGHHHGFECKLVVLEEERDDLDRVTRLVTSRQPIHEEQADLWLKDMVEHAEAMVSETERRGQAVDLAEVVQGLEAMASEGERDVQEPTEVRTSPDGAAKPR